MSNYIKKITILGLFFIWFFTFLVPYSEAMGLYKDHSDSDEKAAVYLASAPMLPSNKIGSECCSESVDAHLYRNLIILSYNSILEEESSFRFLEKLFDQTSLSNRFPLFKLYSVYRL